MLKRGLLEQLESRVLLFGGSALEGIGLEQAPVAEVSSTKTSFILDPTVSVSASAQAQGVAEWEQLANMPRRRSEHSSTLASNGWVYVFGGIRDSVNGVPQVDRFNPTTGVWQTDVTRVPQSRHHFNAVAVGNEVWIVGGKTGSDTTGVTRVDIYNVNTNAWRRGPNLPNEHWGGPTVELNGKLHVLSGGKLRTTTANHHYVLDLQNQSAGWSSLKNVPRPRVHAAAVAVGGKIIMLGGELHHSHDGDRRDVQIYNPANNNWTFGAQIPTARSHIEWNTFVRDGEIWSVSGVNSSRTPRGQDETYIYNPTSNSWRQFHTPLPEELVSPSAVVANDTLFVMGGGEGDWFNGTMKKVWSLDLESGSQPAVPAAPSNVSAVALASDEVMLRWNDNSTNENGFQIQRRTPGGVYANIANLAANVTSFTDDGLHDGTTYNYRLRAFNGSGNSNFSNMASVTTEAEVTQPPTNPTTHSPAAPTNLSATVNGRNVVLRWQDQSNNELGFKVLRRGPGESNYRIVGWLGRNAISFSDQGLSNGTYSYKVRAYNDAGNSPTTNVRTAAISQSGQNQSQPNGPTNLEATVESNAVSLDWNDNSVNETGFKVLRKGPGETGYRIIAYLNRNASAYVDRSVAANRTYHYKVRTYNDAGNSPTSNVVTIRTVLGRSADNLQQVEPDAPTRLTYVVNRNANTVSLAWIDNSNNEEGFKVLRRAPGERGYRIIAIVDRNVTSFVDRDVDDGVYYYKVRAFSDLNSATTNWVTVNF